MGDKKETSDAPDSSQTNSDPKNTMTTINMPDLKKSDNTDEVEEKTADTERKPLTESSTNDAQVVLPDKQNGEATISFGKPAFVGMGKEELMKYANDPFWVRLRWILFILFWLCWVAMLAGAIIIIVLAPKCAAPERRKWWETEMMVKIDNFNDISVDEVLDNMESHNIKTVIVKSRFDAYKSPKDQVLQEMLNVINKAKEKNINVIVGLNPIATDVFRVKSEKSEKQGYENEGYEKYKDYYIWQTGSGTVDSIHTPPNNWVSYVNNKPAWQFNSDRQKFVYQPGGDPVLNFRNPDVPNEFTKIMAEWLELKVNGFVLSDVPYMFVSEDKQSEEPSGKPGAIHPNYDFWRHTKTKNLREIGDVLLKWRDFVKNIDKDAVFMLSDDLDTLDPFMVNETLTIDLPRHSTVFTVAERLSTADSIYKGIEGAFNIIGKYWPSWEYTTTDDLDDSVMSTLTMLLPGTVLLPPDSNFASFKQLQTFRSYGSFLYGTHQLQLLANNTIFTYIRVQAGSPGIVVVCNPTKENKNVNFTSIVQDKQELTLAYYNNNSNSTKAELERMKQSSNVFEVPATATLVFTY